jgi:hypothetical protein
MKRNATKDKKLADNAKLLRAWKRWHREQLEEVLAGTHGAAVARVVGFLDGMADGAGLRSAPALIALLRKHDWNQIDHNVRYVLLHEISTAITNLRERSGLAPIDDALPHERTTGFLIIREILGAQQNARRGIPANSETEA